MNLFDQFDEILSKLKAVGITGALIAGGACRDHLLGRPVKDVDVFVPSQPNIDVKLAQAFGAFNVSPIIAAEYAGAGGEVEHVYEIREEDADPFAPHPLEHVPVQVIVLSPGLNPIERAKHHDFGICQCWYVPHAGGLLSTVGFIQVTEAFHLDMTNQTFTLDHCEDQQQFDRSMRRWARFKGRFQGFELRLPEKYQLFHYIYA
jgi:hypothetical protein